MPRSVPNERRGRSFCTKTELRHAHFAEHEELFLKAVVSPDARKSLAQELERIFQQHYRLVYRTAYSITGSVEDAEDVLQTIFMRLLAREVPPDLRTNPEPYLYKAAFNLSLNTVRQRRRQVLTDNFEI